MAKNRIKFVDHFCMLCEIVNYCKLLNIVKRFFVGKVA